MWEAPLKVKLKVLSLRLGTQDKQRFILVKTTCLCRPRVAHPYIWRQKFTSTSLTMARLTCGRLVLCSTNYLQENYPSRPVLIRNFGRSLTRATIKFLETLSYQNSAFRSSVNVYRRTHPNGLVLKLSLLIPMFSHHPHLQFRMHFCRAILLNNSTRYSEQLSKEYNQNLR